MQLDHINISAPMDLLEQVKDFYCAVLGFSEGPRPGMSRRGFWLYASGRAQIHLSDSGEGHKSREMGHLDHVAFRTADLAGVVRRLESQGISFRRSYRAEDGTTQLFFHDPAGTLLEVNSLDAQ